MAQDIFRTREVLSRIDVISEREESKYSDIPGWDGQIETWTDSAVLMLIRRQKVWLPFSQLRKAEDGQSVYASMWIMEQKGL